MNVLVVGGCGYVGAMLCPHLLTDGHTVTSYDSQLFGNGSLPEENKRMFSIKGDIRDKLEFERACHDQDAVIYLAGITNNDICDKPEAVSINTTAFPLAITCAKKAGVKRFILASSVAIYGSSDHDAKEDDEVVPATKYGQGKHFCETWANLMKSSTFCVTVVRSASVCGLSSRMRFDTTVNKMIHDAAKTGVITVNGGEQKRSHISMGDICRLYKLLVKAPAEVIAGQTFNIVAENLSVREVAEMVAASSGASIEYKPRSDNRSYTVDGMKIRRLLGYETKQKISEVVEYLTTLFQGGYWGDTSADKYKNIVAL